MQLLPEGRLGLCFSAQNQAAFEQMGTACQVKCFQNSLDCEIARVQVTIAACRKM